MCLNRKNIYGMFLSNLVEMLCSGDIPGAQSLAEKIKQEQEFLGEVGGTKNKA